MGLWGRLSPQDRETVRLGTAPGEAVVFLEDLIWV
jgi:hypothetical protein